MKCGVLYCMAAVLVLFSCSSKGTNELCKNNRGNAQDRILNVAINIEFKIVDQALIADIVYKNCFNKPLYFLPSDLGQDPYDTYKYFYIRKLELLNVTDKYISDVKFIQSNERTQYQEDLSSGQVSKIKLAPSQEYTGRFNLSKRYKIQSGLYLVEFGVADYDFTSNQISKGDVLWRINSPTYLVDIDMKKNKILYVKSLQ